MKGSAVILIALALLILYMGVTGKYQCFSLFLSCVNTGPSGCSCGGGEAGGGPIIVTPGGVGAVNISPALPGLPNLPTIGSAA